MKTIRNSLALAALAALGFSATASAASEVVATVVPGSGKAPAAIALDITSGGNVAGFSFRIDVDGVNMQSANLSKCVAQLPKGFSGACSVAKGSIFVYATADAMATVLPAGVNSIGTVYLTDSARLAKVKGKPLNVTIAELSVADSNAKEVAAKSTVSAD